MSANITEHAPILFVRSLEASAVYWTEKVDLTVASLHGEPPLFGILRRGRAYLMLRQAPPEHEIVPYWKISPGLWNAYFWVDDAAALYEELQGRGAIIDYELCTQPYGNLEFNIRDLEDQDIAFGQVVRGT